MYTILAKKRELKEKTVFSHSFDMFFFQARRLSEKTIPEVEDPMRGPVLRQKQVYGTSGISMKYEFRWLTVSHIETHRKKGSFYFFGEQKIKK